MSILNTLGFVAESRPAPIDGNHSLSSDIIHGASNYHAVTPDNLQDELMDTIRPFQVWKGEQLMTQEEVDWVEEQCKEFSASAKKTVSALNKMTKTLDGSAAQVNAAKQKYVRAEGRFERRTIGYKHTTGKYLQGQRVSYAKLGTDYKNTELAADNAIAALTAALN